MRVIIVALSACLVVAGCSDSPTPTKAVHRTSPAPTTTSPSPKPKPKHKPKKPQRSLLSGRWHRPNGPVYAVKIDNTHSGHPQLGLRQADVVYIEQVEGGATRLAAIYSSKYPRHVGPVRSARITDIELLRQYGRVGLFFSGAQRKLLDNLSRSALRLASNDASGYGYYRSGARPAPYNVIGRFHTLRKRVHHVSRPRRVGYSFGPRPMRGHRVRHVKISYPFTRVDGYWSPKHGRWLLSMDGAKDNDGNGYRLGPTTLVVQRVNISASVFHDVLGNNTPRSHTLGKGRAMYFRDGRVFYGTWSRSKRWEPTRYWFGHGKHRHRMSFAAGQLWIALVDRKTPVGVG
jgi:hypothetical protein